MEITRRKFFLGLFSVLVVGVSIKKIPILTQASTSTESFSLDIYFRNSNLGLEGIVIDSFGSPEVSLINGFAVSRIELKDFQ